MIYVSLFYRKDENWEASMPLKVIITYPNEEDFMKERVKKTITPFNGHLHIQKGTYSTRGFFPNELLIEGEHNEQRFSTSLPLSSCIIERYYTE